MSDPQTKAIILQLLSNISSAREVRQYLQRFSAPDAGRFAIVKVGGGILMDQMADLASSLTFLHQVGLHPIVIHGAGPQLDAAMQQAGIQNIKRDNLRVTSAEALKIVRRVFQAENLKILEALQELGTAASSIPGGVFEARLLDFDRYGYVGDVTSVHLDAVHASLRHGRIPVIASLGETTAGQILNINSDMAAKVLTHALKPYKIIFLTSTGGLLDGGGDIIPSINLSTDYRDLMASPWLHSGMQLKIEQIRDLLLELPLSSSVSITKPSELAKELFTHKGSGTLVRLGENIRIHKSWEGVNRARLAELIEESFGRRLKPGYFDETRPDALYVSSNYRAAAIMTRRGKYIYLDKFAVLEDARGEGLGRTVWQHICRDYPAFFWRSRADNPINEFYFQESDGCMKRGYWTIFWRGLDDFADMEQVVRDAGDHQLAWRDLAS